MEWETREKKEDATTSGSCFVFVIPPRSLSRYFFHPPTSLSFKEASHFRVVLVAASLFSVISRSNFVVFGARPFFCGLWKLLLILVSRMHCYSKSWFFLLFSFIEWMPHLLSLIYLIKFYTKQNSDISFSSIFLFTSLKKYFWKFIKVDSYSNF